MRCIPIDGCPQGGWRPGGAGHFTAGMQGLAGCRRRCGWRLEALGAAHAPGPADAAAAEGCGSGGGARLAQPIRPQTDWAVVAAAEPPECAVASAAVAKGLPCATISHAALFQHEGCVQANDCPRLSAGVYGPLVS